LMINLMINFNKFKESNPQKTNNAAMAHSTAKANAQPIDKANVHIKSHKKSKVQKKKGAFNENILTAPQLSDNSLTEEEFNAFLDTPGLENEFFELVNVFPDDQIYY